MNKFRKGKYYRIWSLFDGKVYIFEVLKVAKHMVTYKFISPRKYAEIKPQTIHEMYLKGQEISKLKANLIKEE